jgi:hypothetical protein
MKKIDVNDPSLWQSIDWDEKPQPDLLKKSDHHVNLGRANRLKANDKQITEKISESVKKSYINQPELKEKRKKIFLETQEKNLKDPSYRKKIQEKNQNQYNDPAYLKAYYDGIEKRNSSLEWKNSISNAAEKRKNDPIWCQFMKEKHGVKVSTPHGIFNTMGEAAHACNISTVTLKTYIDLGKEGYFVIGRNYKKPRRGLPVRTPYGIFPGKMEACKYAIDNELFNNVVKFISKMLQQKLNGYEYITQEEYIRLTGHNPYE